MLKIVLFFLAVMLILSMVGNLVTKFLAPPPPEEGKTRTQDRTRAKCAHCGRSVVGTAPCICGQG